MLLPSFVPLTFCIHPYTGALSWMARGNCGSTLLAHVLPDDGPLAYCQHAYTGALRYSPNGKCSPVERAGEMPMPPLD